MTTKYPFTVFCQHEDGGTIHINTVEADNHNAKDAAVIGRGVAAKDWECSANQVKVLGVVEGSVQPCLWSDEGLELPVAKVLQSVKIDFDAWPGAPFQGGKIIEIDRESFDNEQALEGALEEVEDLLEDLADDDPLGPLLNRIRDHIQAMVGQGECGQEPATVRIVSPSGRYKLNDDGDPELYSGTSSPVFDENFDISVSIIPVMEGE